MKPRHTKGEIKRCYYLLLLLGLLIGCSHAVPLRRQSSRAEIQIGSAIARTGLAGSVVLLAENVQSTYLDRNFLPLWNPASNDVVEALDRLPVYLAQDAEKLAVLHEGLPKTVCQIVGISFQGRRGILLNFLPAEHSFTRAWREEFIKVHDGGPRFWSIVYCPEDRTFTRLRINGYF